MQDRVIEVSLFADESDFDTLIGVLTGLGFEAFWEDGSALKCYIPGSTWSPELLKEVEASVSRVVSGRHIPSPRFVVTTIENRNWNDAWEKTIKPIRIGSRLIVKPSWHPHDSSPDEIVITIDPKMSFGTGHHETTRLVSRLLERHINHGDVVLDIGTGTGILAIAAITLGAGSATGIDTDEWSYHNSIENTRLNHVEEQVSVLQCSLPDLPPSPRYDVIVANIQRTVILPLLPEMKLRLKPAGKVLLSGLLQEEENETVDALHACGFRVIEEVQENEWIALAASLRRIS
jgi:ribosomal protein L11 methyltransferase